MVVFAEVGTHPKDLIDDNITGKRGLFNPVRRLRCAWGDRYGLVSQLWYTAYPYVTASLAIATKFAIQPFPDSRLVSSGDASKTAFDEALVEVFYTSDRYHSGSVYFVEEFVPHSGFNARMPHTGIYWDTGGATPLLENEGPILGYPSMKYILTYFQLPSIPLSWLAFQNTVNNGAMTCKAFSNTVGITTTPISFTTDMVRYEGAKISHSLTLAGATYFTAKLEFDYTYRNGWGWQGVWNPRTCNFGAIYDSGGTQLLPYSRSTFAF